MQLQYLMFLCFISSLYELIAGDKKVAFDRSADNVFIAVLEKDSHAIILQENELGRYQGFSTYAHTFHRAAAGDMIASVGLHVVGLVVEVNIGTQSRYCYAHVYRPVEPRHCFAWLMGQSVQDPYKALGLKSFLHDRLPELPEQDASFLAGVVAALRDSNKCYDDSRV